jgi:UDP-N-acetylglucosamine 2-epimerase (non-hydrolysing)
MEEKSLKVMTILGTRPEIIRLSRVIPLLDRYACHILVHTCQNYDYELNEVFFRDLGLRKPDYFLNVDTTSLGRVLGETLIKTEELLKSNRPDAVLILGDTNSSIAAIISKRYKIPVYHMEAGNRCFDANVPEEINRKIIDHISDFNLVYTEHARRHLLSEGFPHRRIVLTGSPMYEVLQFYRDRFEKSGILEQLKLPGRGYFVVSLHREENVDNPLHLAILCSTLNRIAETYQLPVIVSTHPRTRKRMEDSAEKVDFHPLVRFCKPFGFLDYMKLQQNAACTISDSGTISEESSILSFPAVTLRNSMERPEALDAGTILLTGVEEQNVLRSIDLVMQEHANGIRKQIPPEYLVPDTSWRVAKLILGTANLSNRWAGINPAE